MKTVLITGSARRLGAIMARHCAAAGWQVLIHYNRSAKAADATVTSLRERGHAAHAIGADLADRKAVAGLIAKAQDVAGEPVTALINNASVFNHDLAQTFTAEGLTDHMQINLEAPVTLSRDMAAALPTDQPGCIINILDQKLWNLNPDHFTYTLSKYALKGATEMLALALAPQIRVCGLAPGFTLQNEDRPSDDFEALAASGNLRGQPIDPEMIGRTALFILENSALTGEIIRVDNGEHMVPATRDIAYRTPE